MPLRLALGVRGTVAGRRLGALEGGGGISPSFLRTGRRFGVWSPGGVPGLGNRRGTWDSTRPKRSHDPPPPPPPPPPVPPPVTVWGEAQHRNDRQPRVHAPKGAASGLPPPEPRSAPCPLTTDMTWALLCASSSPACASETPPLPPPYHRQGAHDVPAAPRASSARPEGHTARCMGVCGPLSV